MSQLFPRWAGSSASIHVLQQNPPSSAARHPLWQGQVALVLCVLLACLIGIYSRPIGYLAAFWPANPIMLGLLLRHPNLGRRPSTWLMGWCIYMLADMLTGASLVNSALFNTANLMGILAGWLYFHHRLHRSRVFQRQSAVLHLFACCMIASIGSTILGAPAMSWAFSLPPLQSTATWISAEFYCFVLVLPIFLSAPQGWFWTWKRSDVMGADAQQMPLSILPVVSLIIAEAATLFVGGPGSLAFIMPSMIWCAMAYGVFPLTLITLLVCTWKIATISMGAMPFTPDNFYDVMSFRVGLALLSLAPLAVASAYALRTRALQKLHHAVNHDYLTGTLARRAMMEQGQKLLSRLQADEQPVAVLMMDIDHFKQVNDRHGHAQGDVVLQEFAMLARNALRPEDLLGRMGGEEFAILLPRTSQEQAVAIGERICQRLRDHTFPLPQGQLHTTLSVGLHAVSRVGPQDSLEHLLSKADQALYAAKNSGRNQVRQYRGLDTAAV